jgi:hypothetical protein
MAKICQLLPYPKIPEDAHSIPVEIDGSRVRSDFKPFLQDHRLEILLVD